MENQLRFFGSWSGYSIPVHLTDALEYEEAESRDTFLVAQYDANRRVVEVKKYINERSPIPIDKVPCINARASVVFFEVDLEEESGFGESISLEQTKDLEDYIRVVVDDAGQVSASERVHRSLMLHHRYEYWDGNQVRACHYRRHDGEIGTYLYDRRGRLLDSN